MNAISKFFKLSERNTSVRTEFIAGLSTFLAMSYILVVNPKILSEMPDGLSIGVYIT